MLSNASIKTKLTAIILLITGFCIAIVLSVFIYINQSDEQDTTVSNISVLAKLIGNRSTAALTFFDKNLAQGNLSSLDTHPTIILSCLYDSNGKLFASFLKKDLTSYQCNEKLASPPTTATHVIENNHLLLFEPIFLENEYLGSILIRASLQLVRDHLFRYLLIAVLSGLAASILALIFASKLQAIILSPLLALTQTAQKVSQVKDYSVRAEKYGQDEVGELVDSFNGMLSTIETQNKVLIKTTEKANAANAVKSQFLANMSHELRTPINGVLGMNDLLKVTSLTEEQKEYVDLARQSGNVLLDTVNQILDMASIESTGLTLTPEEVDTQMFIEDIAQLFSAQLAAKKLDLVIYIESALPTHLFFDQVRMRQVFINLITNAIKFTHQGGVTVRIRWYQSRLQVHVEDTGIGIPEEAQQRIFESFQQVDNSSTRAFGGTGLGLPISKEICLAMSGSIEVERSSHAGSIFYFDVHAPTTHEKYVQLKQPDFAGEILILSEVTPVGKWFEEILQKFRLKYHLVNQLSDAIALLPQVNLVIIDEKIGTDIYTKLFSHPSLNGQRIVLLTWVGIQLPSSLEKDAQVIFKPMTENKLVNLFVEEIKPKAKSKMEKLSFHILLAEDNEINLKAMKSQLIHAGFKVTTACNGLQAVQSCREQYFDLVLMDIQMPEMDGLEATRQIKLEQGIHAPRIIGISAHVMKEHIDNAYQAGMEDYLCKPIKEDDLLNAINDKLQS